MLLSKAAKDQFVEQGFLRFPAMIGAARIKKCRERIDAALQLDASDPTTWPEDVIAPVPQLEADMGIVATEEIDAIKRQLVGDGFVPRSSYVPVLNFPRFGAKEFNPHGFHIDGVGESTLLPVRRYLLTFVYASDVDPCGGAVAAIPGSHRQIFEHYWKTGTAPDGDTDAPDGPDYGTPIPLDGPAGTVIFLHYLLAHGSSDNRTSAIRVSLNGKTAPTTAYQRKHGAPQDNWTPMDITLRTDTLKH
ncbi:MAG: phytanoyl-CoA dioxygenase family protein [Rhizomicrobium sp.]